MPVMKSYGRLQIFKSCLMFHNSKKLILTGKILANLQETFRKEPSSYFCCLPISVTLHYALTLMLYALAFIDHTFVKLVFLEMTELKIEINCSGQQDLLEFSNKLLYLYLKYPTIFELFVENRQQVTKLSSQDTTSQIGRAHV